MFRIFLMGLAFLGAFLGAPAQASLVLQTDPLNGAISGNPGDLVGWGFTLNNDTDYALITSVDFTGAGILGSFTDYLGPQGIVVGPVPESSSVSQSFDPNIPEGLGGFQISAGASPGAASGEILVTYDLFSLSPNDPNFDPDVNTVSLGNIVSANASVTVTAAVVPIPGAMWLMGSGMIALLGRTRRPNLVKHAA